MEEKCKSEIYLCACHGEGIKVEKWDDNEIYIAFWSQGLYSKYPMTFKERLRWIWAILTTGRVWADEVILTESTAELLGRYLLSLCEKPVETNQKASEVTCQVEYKKCCWNCDTLIPHTDALCPKCGKEND
jgi:hypothetical protein